MTPKNSDRSSDPVPTPDPMDEGRLDMDPEPGVEDRCSQPPAQPERPPTQSDETPR